MTARDHRTRLWRLSTTAVLFISIVALPTLISAVYYLAIATPLYVSEAHFVVRSGQSRQSAALPSFFRSLGFGRADDDAATVKTYLQSRDALRELDQRLSLRDRVGDGDPFSRYPNFWRRASSEALFDYYLRRIAVSVDVKAGISHLRVTMFRPQDAQLVTDTLLQLGEEFVNRMNNRANADAIQQAERELARAEERVIRSQSALTAFRNREFLIDPASATQQSAELVTRLSGELAQARMQLDQTIAAAPGSPGIAALRLRISALSDQIAAERARIVGGDDALAAKFAAYERLALDRGFADQALAVAMAALETARRDARRQLIYIETVAAPSLPDVPTEPRRLRALATVFVSTFALFAMTWLALMGAREHADG